MTSPSRRKHVRFDCSRSSSIITTTTSTTTTTTTTITAITTTTATSSSSQSVSSLLQNYSGFDIKNSSQNLIQSYFPTLSFPSSNTIIKEASLSSLITPTLSSTLLFHSRDSSNYQQTYPQQTLHLPNSALPQYYQPKSIIRNSHIFKTAAVDQPYENTSSSIPYSNIQSLISISPQLQVTTISSYLANSMNYLSNLDMVKSSRSQSQPHQ
ncbi:hypothetical protein LOAG_15626, partial [Loa loa]